MTTKQKILKAIQTMRDDVSVDQVIDSLYLLQKVERGVQQADQGDVIDHDEFMNELLDDDEKG